MSSITFKGTPAHTVGTLPDVGETAKEFNLTGQDLSEVTLATFGSKRKILNIFPSVDTGVCAASVRAFHKAASQLLNTVVLNISVDLPFATKRFCAAEGIDNVEAFSTFRSTFADDYGVRLTDSPLKGLCSRAVIVLDESNKVLYTQQVAEITTEPDYASALKTLS